MPEYSLGRCLNSWPRMFRAHVCRVKPDSADLNLIRGNALENLDSKQVFLFLDPGMQ